MVSHLILNADLRAALADKEVVSFDVFDTLFVRPLHDPEDLFDLVGQRFSIPDFRLHRRAAQQEAFRRMHAAGRKEITLDGIYECLPDLGIPARALAEAEMELELKLTIPNRQMLPVFRSLAAEKKVVIASDMYLPLRFFERLFRENGLPDVPLYVSSECDATKRDSGELFDRIVADLGCAPDRILHIGDNPVSDIQRARERGLATYHYEHDDRPALKEVPGLAASLAVSLPRVLPKAFERRSPYDIAFRYGGPCALAYLDWVTERAHADGIDLILFISRDGYILDKIARRRRETTLPRHAYFMGSRVAFALAATNEHNYDQMAEFFLDGSDGLMPFEVFERIGVSPPSDKFMRDIGLGDDVTLSSAHRPLMLACFRALKGRVLQTSHTTRRLLFRYLTSLGVESGMRVALVDVGWNGTTQDYLARALQGMMEVDLHGYYLCLNDSPQVSARRSRLQMSGLISSQSFNPDFVRTVYDNRLIIELLFSAPHHTVIGYREGPDGDVEPLEDPVRGKPSADGDLLDVFHRGMLDFIGAYDDLCRAIEFKPSAGDLIQVVKSLFHLQDEELAKLMDRAANFDTWASSRRRVAKA